MSNYAPSVMIGSVLASRYQIIRELGRGGFGRTYLAQDHNRYQELCVIKEFDPQTRNPQELQKAEELFQREAGMLYQLNHDQIPPFKELFHANLGQEDALFLVQGYVEGQTYWQLLQSGQKFSETDIIQLLQDILPVLTYIHSLNIIHRDLSPDNIIQRQQDGKPMLIDFGCVRVAVTNISEVFGQSLGTLVGKPGYAAPEQMRQGNAYPSSDLYGLAVTAIVLLTGKEPQDLYDRYNSDWIWHNLVQVSPKLREILNKMLAYHPGDRYQTASEVLQALNNLNNNQNPIFSQVFSRIATLVVAPANRHQSQYLTTQHPPSVTSQPTISHTAVVNPTVTSPSNFRLPAIFGKIVKIAIIGASVTILPAFVTFHLLKVVDWQDVWTNITQIRPIGIDKTEIPEKDRIEQIKQRIKALNLKPGSFYEEVDQLFYNKYPELKGKKLGDSSEDAKLRSKWYDIAEDLLDRKEK